MPAKKRSADVDSIYDEAPSRQGNSRNMNNSQQKNNPVDTVNECEETSSDDDFVSIIADVFRKINYKVAIFLFLVGIFIMSDLYEGVLRKFNGITAEGCVTSRGSVFQLTMLVLAYIVVDLLTKYEFI